ncbi:MAG: fold metallo-hydrolase [Gammaproteobacteria bacterium]|nr:fold metallo-hydrolase [Gammaproteobacteria bacterium]
MLFGARAGEPNANPSSSAALAGGRVTILYDAFGKPSSLERGWGYSALIEYGGKRILFDTGGRYDAFAGNVKKLGVDLTKLDFVVLSHRHGDHTAGLAYVLKLNPSVRIYAPDETGSFGTPPRASSGTGKAIARKVDGLPSDLHYFDGKYADAYPVDSPWPGANITLVDQPIEVMPGFYLFKTVSDVKGTLELNEISMAIRTPRGLAVFVGCSHPGIEKILAVAAGIDPHLYTLIGGLHLLDKPDQDVLQIVDHFQNVWKLERVAAGHCTGEFAQAALEQTYRERHDHSGLGEVIALP